MSTNYIIILIKMRQLVIVLDLPKLCYFQYFLNILFIFIFVGLEDNLLNLLKDDPGLKSRRRQFLLLVEKYL